MAGTERFRNYDRMMRRVAWGIWIEQERRRREAAAVPDPGVPFWLTLIEQIARPNESPADTVGKG
jgi:hypothetical protein